MLPNQKEKHPQVEDRTWRVYTDNHGRKWGASRSKTTDRPASPLKPQGWSAPVKGGLPPERFIRHSEDPERPTLLTIDYDGLIGAYRDSLDEWNREVQRLSQKFPDKTRQQCEEIAGPPPFPWQYWLACKDEKADGHAWALGQSKKRPEWADMYFAPPKAVEADASFLYSRKSEKQADKQPALTGA